MRRLTFIFLVLVAVGAGAQEPTELYDCVDDADGPDFCSQDSTAVLVDQSCGVTFNRYHGIITWSGLRNAGPVTISVQTRTVPFGTTDLPLYIEVMETLPGDQGRCRANAGALIFAAKGGAQCGGTWESVGPIDLAYHIGVPLGGLYNIQAVFLESAPIPGHLKFHSVGFSCIRVTSHPSAVASTTWAKVKVLYQ